MFYVCRLCGFTVFYHIVNGSKYLLRFSFFLQLFGWGHKCSKSQTIVQRMDYEWDLAHCGRIQSIKSNFSPLFPFFTYSESVQSENDQLMSAKCDSHIFALGGREGKIARYLNKGLWSVWFSVLRCKRRSWRAAVRTNFRVSVQLSRSRSSRLEGNKLCWSRARGRRGKENVREELEGRSARL